MTTLIKFGLSVRLLLQRIVRPDLTIVDDLKILGSVGSQNKIKLIH